MIWVVDTSIIVTDQWETENHVTWLISTNHRPVEGGRGQLFLRVLCMRRPMKVTRHIAPHDHNDHVECSVIDKMYGRNLIKFWRIITDSLISFLRASIWLLLSFWVLNIHYLESSGLVRYVCDFIELHIS